MEGNIHTIVLKNAFKWFVTIGGLTQYTKQQVQNRTQKGAVNNTKYCGEYQMKQFEVIYRLECFDLCAKLLTYQTKDIRHKSHNKSNVNIHPSFIKTICKWKQLIVSINKLIYKNTYTQ